MTNTKKLQDRFFQLRSNRVFEFFVIAVIIFSALVIGVKTYNLPPTLIKIVHLLDWAITLFFLVEISIRFLGEPEKRSFFKKGWNIFDSAIVLVSLIPIEDSEMALVGRLIRIFRVLRMISVIPELRMLLNSLLKAMPQLGYVMLMLFIIFYIYAAVGSTFFAGINPVLWGDISISMLTLFRVMTFEDWTDVMYETMEVHAFSWIFYLSFIFLTAFAFLNMVIGIVVSVMEKENQQERKDAGEPTLRELQAQLADVQQMLRNQR